MLLFKYTVANHRQNIICFYIYINVRIYSEILLIVNHFTKIPSLRYLISRYTDEKARMRQFPNRQVGCSVEDATLQKAAYMPSCRSGPRSATAQRTHKN